MVNSLYESFDCPIIRTSLSGAEMIKYAANSFLATKISFINEIANICELVGIDVGEVAVGIGYDDRISPRFLRAGIGYGGSCFPKDVKALLSLSRQMGRESNLLDVTVRTNIQQPLRAIDLLSNFIDINGKIIGLLGLAFKPETDDMREAPSVIIANKLRELGAIVKGYDPIAKDTAKKALPNITHTDSISELIQDCDAVVLVTEWKEFKTLKPNDFKSMRGNVIIDGRRILDWKVLIDAGYQMKVIGQAIP
jgi:UDPglucose 6-dehydrogenase